MKQWWLDERAYAGQEHLDPAYVAAYDRKSGYDPAGDIAKLREYGLDSHSLVVDLGAGSGIFASAVAPLCGSVIALDVSPAMTAAIRARVADAGLRNVDVVEAGILSYEHRGEPADFVFTRNVLHQLPDAWKAVALERIAAILRPSGILRLHDLIFDFEPGEFDEKIEAWLAGAETDPARGYTSDDLAQHIRTEFSTYSWLLEAMLERTGFDVLEREYRRSAYGSYVCRLRGRAGEKGK